LQNVKTVAQGGRSFPDNSGDGAVSRRRTILHQPPYHMKTPLLFAIVTCLAAASSGSSAATATWKGGTAGVPDTWNISTNWQGGTGPGGNDAVCPASGSWIGMMQNTDAAVNSLAINAGGYGFNDSGAVGGGLKVAGGGITATYSGSAMVTFNTPVRLDASQSWNMNGSRGTLLWNEPVNLNGKTLTITGTGIHEFQGGLSGAGNLLKTGTGRAVFDSAITGGGGCTVSEGTAEFNHATMTKTVSLVAPGIVAGSGSITSLGTNGGTVRPGGNLTGILSVLGSVMLNASAQIDIELNGNTPGSGHDQLAAGSSVSLNNAALNLTIESGYVPLIGKPVVMVNNQGANPVTGTFAGLPEGATIVKGAITFRISYAGGTDGGNEVTLTPVSVAPSGIERVWTGNADQFWTTPGNWSGGIAPQPGDNVQFPEVAAEKKTAHNTFPSGYPLHLVRLTAGGYTLSGFGISLSDGIVQQAPSGSAENLLTFDLALDPPDAPASTKRVRLQSGGPLTVDPTLGFGFYHPASVLVLQNDQAAPLLTSRIFLVGGCAVAKHGPGPVLQDEVSQHSGGTYIYAGKFQAAVPGSLGSGVVGVDAGAELRLGKSGGAAVMASNQLDLAGTLSIAANTPQHQWSGIIRMENGIDGTISSAGGGLLITGKITGDAGLQLSGEGPVTIAGGQNNDYTGFTAIAGIPVTCSKVSANTAIPGSVSVTGTGGKLITATNYSIGMTSDLTITGGASVDLGGQNILNKVILEGGALKANSLTLQDGLDCLASAQSSTLAGMMYVPPDAGLLEWHVEDGAAEPDLSFNGSVYFGGFGTGELIKSGPGTLRVVDGAGTSVIQVQLRIDAGRVDWLEKPESGMPAGPDVVMNGGTLAGTGHVSKVTSLGGGVVSPGGSPGALFTKDLQLRENVICAVELTAGDCDSVRVNGTVDCGGATLAASGNPPGYGESRVIVDNDGADPVSGNFSGLPEGATFPLGGGMVSITYSGGDGNDIALIRVPPPAPEDGAFQIAGHLAGGGQPGAPPVRYSGTGIPGFSYALEVSIDLETWAIAATGAADAGGVIHLEWSPPTIPARRFFRVRAL
jgi:hypothetical protein